MAISRRIALSGAALLAGAPIAAAAQTRAGVATQAPEDFGALPSTQQLWDDLLFMVSCGSRNTGFPGQHRFVEFLAQRLQEIPGLQVFRDRYSLTKWEATSYSLAASGRDRRFRPFHATSAYPNSGRTGPSGVSGPLIDLGVTTPNEVGGSNPIAIERDIRGKIVLLRAPVHGFPFAANFRVWGASSPDVTMPDRIREAIWQNRSGPPLDVFKTAGAAGVILCWEGVSDENAEGQYVPFGRPYADLPCLWVGEATGAELRALAAQGGRARITLEATQTPDTQTETLYALLPGRSDEIILVHTHSDGPNAVEENAPIGVVALAKYLAALPAGSRNRTYLFTMTTGHMAYSPTPKSWHGFAEAHPELVQRAVGALVFEHLGARAWVDRDGAYVPSGQNQTTMVITRSRALADLALRSCSGTIDDRLIAVDPYRRRYTGESGGVIESGIPTIGIMPVPSYLLKESAHGGIERIDPRLFRVQLENFTRMLRAMDAMSREQLAVPALEPRG